MPSRRTGRAASAILSFRRSCGRRGTTFEALSPPGLFSGLRHDDAARANDHGAERAQQLARERGWTLVSMQDDWKTISPEYTS
jgi:hypothetical protein